jgi:DNA polymerase I-like protein with 3'-5' exonuclease and polymerase domains
MKLVFDIETDNLLNSCTRMWVLTAYNLDTEEMHVFLEGDLKWIELFNKATRIIGHNILGFDIFVLKKLFGYEFPSTCNFQDTLILSQILNYKRFGNEGHSLGRWGEHLKFPKYDFNDWSKLSQEMIDYCIQDTKLTARVYKELMKEYKEISERAPKLKYYLRAEHAAAKWATEASLHGWPFNLKAANELHAVLKEEMNKAYQSLSSKLGYKLVAVDKKNGIVEPKRPKWTKQGCYDVHTANWFGVDPWSGFETEERIIRGEYSRVEVKPLSLDSVADVKTFLYRNGWEPTEWNFKIDELSGKKKKTSPKITEDSLEFLGGDGKLYLDFLTARSRCGILETWIKNTDENGMLHGDCMVIGTPSMRSRHSIIVNVPSADSPWGKEMRSLFSCLPGWKLIGCDSAGNQARGLAHYLGNEKYTNILLNGDIHQHNADILTKVLLDMHIVYGVKRAHAKRVLYAFLFGASGAKLWSYIFGNLDVENGKKLKSGFLKAVPGFKDLLEKLENIYGKTSQTGDGYIPSLAGNRIYVDSFHKLLVYLLQSAEKITCASALMLTVERLNQEGIPYKPCIFYHDEIDFMVPEEFAERASEIGKKAFADGPKLFGVNIMDGGAKIGDNWYDVH